MRVGNRLDIQVKFRRCDKSVDWNWICWPEQESVPQASVDEDSEIIVTVLGRIDNHEVLRWIRCRTYPIDDIYAIRQDGPILARRNVDRGVHIIDDVRAAAFDQ